ncbi:tyrosine recombinase XerS [Peribacillus butanolivorans]|uniref:tyrosine recombinase XerS n=1 Tax=Peribacillus butanolivorans TaxID=421767 RepID=UPI0035DF3FEC
MASARETLIHEKRLNTHLASMPEYVVEFVQAKKRAKYSSSTLLGYIHEYKKFFEWLQHEGISKVDHIKYIPLPALENLTKKNAEFYKEFLEEEIISEKDDVIKKRSGNAVARNINAIKSLFNYLTTETEDEETGECYFYRNVFSKVKLNKKDEDTASRRAKKISSIILNDKEINEFLDYLKNGYENPLSPHKKGSFLRDKERDIALISMMLGSGVRVSEISSLTFKDINFQKKQLDIIRKGGKADTVEILDSALNDLKEYLRIRETRYPGANSTSYVFVSKYAGTARPISVRAIQDLVTKYTIAFNSQEEFSSGQALSPHKLRHTFASEWIKNGGNLILLRDQLGHNSIETTQKYTNLSSKESKKVMHEIEKARDQTKN